MPAEEYSRPSCPYLSYHVASCVPPGLQSISLKLGIKKACNLVLVAAGAVQVQHGQEESYRVLMLFARPIRDFVARSHSYNRVFLELVGLSCFKDAILSCQGPSFRQVQP